jgi:glycine dehydrogenase
MILDPEPFQTRHIGPDQDEAASMLKAIGASSMDTLIDEAIPARIRLKRPLQLPAGLPEHEYLRMLRGLAAKNQPFRSYIGLGYYDCVTPSVILRNVLENPSWYTPYTPYQAEIAQGRLEALLNFQTMVRDLTGMEVATASLLDEATAAAEAMTMLHRVHSRSGEQLPPQFFVADSCFPQGEPNRLASSSSSVRSTRPHSRREPSAPWYRRRTRVGRYTTYVASSAARKQPACSSPSPPIFSASR